MALKPTIACWRPVPVTWTGSTKASWGNNDTSPFETFDLREMKRMKNKNSAGDDETLDDGIDEETVFAFVPIAAVPLNTKRLITSPPCQAMCLC
eukprot:CAMPEP_0171325378 /NCGR_PEP_ID=MMETSP0816-20121228/116774_1 /TAXON_ID=420281 /ORGANISM="Proboscia inermis, Strain CCAP1064/1" /LENGTH=93 /DNA_ID=CAMNT_0011824545 /DNA_START=397 /DNA_END=679 /DNA_ORIENTATION=-